MQVSARGSGAPVADATIRLFADYERSCAQQGLLTAELVTDAEGTLRLEAEGPRLDGGTCFSLSAEPPPGSGLAPAQRVTFSLEFRAAPPLDSTQVEVMLEAAP